jgi:hypothetical protein
MYKVPGRMIYCSTIKQWIQEILWCYVIMKLFRTDIEGMTENYGNPPVAETVEIPK